MVTILETSELKGRTGEVLRQLPHGTVMIWDLVKERSYPFYKAGHMVFREKETVEFITDKTDTFIVQIYRNSGSGRRTAVRPLAHEEAAIQRSIG